MYARLLGEASRGWSIKGGGGVGGLARSKFTSTVLHFLIQKITALSPCGCTCSHTLQYAYICAWSGHAIQSAWVIGVASALAVAVY